MSVAALPAASGAPDKTDKPSERFRGLRKERVKALETQLEGLPERVNLGKEPLGTLLEAYAELTDAEMELADSPAAEVKVLERAIERLKEFENSLKEPQKAGLQTKQNVAMAWAARVKAEIRLEKRKAAK